jgi:hypothetical protein
LRKSFARDHRGHFTTPDFRDAQAGGRVGIKDGGLLSGGLRQLSRINFGRTHFLAMHGHRVLCEEIEMAGNAFESLLAPVVRVLAIIALVPLSSGAWAYTFITLDPPGATWSAATGMNVHGQVVGNYTDSSPAEISYGFVWSANEGFKTLNPPGSRHSTAEAINRHGQVVGSYRDANGIWRGYQWDRASGFTDILPLVGSAASSGAAGINGHGQVVGTMRSWPDGLEVGYLREGSGSYKTYSAPGPSNTYLFGINASGQAVGAYSADNNIYGLAVASDGSFDTFVAPGATSTCPTGMNNRGTIVGWFSDGRSQPSFMRTSDGSFTVFSVPGSDFPSAWAWAVNDHNDIVGSYPSYNFMEHGFVRDRLGRFTTLDFPGADRTALLGITNDGLIFGRYSDSCSESCMHAFLAVP